MRGLAIVLLFAGCDEIFDLEHVPPVEVPPDLVAHFPMERIVSERLDDLVGTSDGACTAAECPTETAGMLGNALLFDGVMHVITAPSPEPLQAAGSFTAAVWARMDHAPTVTNAACVLSKRLGNAQLNSWQFCTSMGRWALYTNNGSETDPMIGPPIRNGVWIHLAVTWDIATQETRFYGDGSVFGMPMQHNTGADPGPLVIGGDIDDGSVGAWFPGAVDEVRLYRRALTDEEVFELGR